MSRNIKQQQARAVAAVWAIVIFAALLMMMMMMSRSASSQVSAFTTTTISSRSKNNNAVSTVTTKNNNHERRISSSSSVLSMSTTSTATMLPEGLVKTIVNNGERSASSIERGDIVTVKYTCYSVSSSGTDDNTKNNVLLARSDSQKTIVGDRSMVPGWDQAILSMKMGERSVIRVTDPNLGYGIDGKASQSYTKIAFDALGLTMPESNNDNDIQLELDIQILKVQPAAAAAELFDMNFDAMALADDTPKTAQDIAAAYESRMAMKEPDKEGLEGWIETVKNYYFFGFFEGETGEEAPWYLKPSITFPIAFAVVGAAFWVSVLSGAISEKGQQSIDELDTIVQASLYLLSTNSFSLPM